MPRRRSVSSSSSSSPVLNRRSQDDLPPPSLSAGMGIDEYSSLSSDDSLDIIIADESKTVSSWGNSTRRCMQAEISTKCGGIDATTTTRQRRLCVAYDGEHKVWHLVPPETLSSDAGEDNAEMSLLQEAGAHCPVGREMGSFFHLQEKHLASGTSSCSTKKACNIRVSDGDQVDGIQSGYVDDDVDSEQGAREITIKGGSTLEAGAMQTGVEEHIPVKKKIEMHDEMKLGHATCDTTRSSGEAGNGSAVSSAEKVRLEDDCRAMVAAAAVAAAACGQMVRTKNVDERAMLDTSDGHQGQKPGNNDVFKGISREMNLAEGAGKEPRKGEKIDGAAVPGGGKKGNNMHINEENPRVFQSSVGSSTELRSSRTGPLADQNGMMSPTPRRSLSIGQARVTWRGATVDPTETWDVILKETRPGQPRAENKNKRSNRRPGSSLGGAKGSLDGTVISSSHELPAVVSNGKGQEDFKAASNNATPSFHDKRRLMETQDEQRPSTSHQTLVKGDLKLWHEQGQKDPKPKTFWGEPKRGPSCSNHSEMLTNSIPENASNSLTKTRPVYFLPTPYAGPQIANCPRAWPNGVRTLSATSDPRIREEAAKGGHEQRTIVDEHKEMWFPESKK